VAEHARTTLVTGASGQDGSYLCEQLLAEGATLHALHHAASGPGLDAYPWAAKVTWHQGDLADAGDVTALVTEIGPDEIYNLAGVSSVAQSWADPMTTAQVTGVGALTIMDAAWRLQESSGRQVQVLQASSAEIFGSPARAPQDESTPIKPVSPYGAAKAFAHHLAAVYRERGLAVSTCILYNHESPRRPPTFVTRKITRGAAAIALGQSDELALGNLDAVRDWGWAPDYVDAMVRANRSQQADDYVIATGTGHAVRDFVAAAFSAAGVADWERHVRIDPRFVRPADPAVLCGDPSRARERLGWQPTVTFEEMVAAMVANDLNELRG
jgi:GDPmannose 4,6-dehydratase